MVMIYGIELENADSCLALMCEVEKDDGEAFVYCEEWTCDYCPPSDWSDFHDYFCDWFETDEEYEEFKAFIDQMASENVPFPEMEQQEDPHEAGWYAWRTSRGV